MKGKRTFLALFATIISLSAVVCFCSCLARENDDSKYGETPEYCAVKFVYGYGIESLEISVEKNMKTVLPNPTVTGYKFDGWTNGTQTFDGGDTVTVSDDIVFYARWSAIEYSITYVLNGGSLDTVSDKFTIEDLPLDLPIPDCASDMQTFAYWTTDAEGLCPVSKIPKSENNLKNIMLYAHYDYSDKFMSYRYNSQLKGYIVTKYSGSARKVEIPDTYNGLPVKAVGGYAFYNCDWVTDVTVPDSVTSIGSQAFYGCKGLENVNIPDSVNSIGSAAFYNCQELMSITIPDAVTRLYASTFQNCIKLAQITIPDNMTSIYGSAFENCKGLTQISIPQNVKSIGSFAFKGCSGINNITIHNGVTLIGEGAFEGCTGLKTVYVDSVRVANTTSHNLFDYAENIYILDGTELANNVFANSYVLKDGLVNYGGKPYWHYVKKYNV